jgi:Mor family transcriptional regulator
MQICMFHYIINSSASVKKLTQLLNFTYIFSVVCNYAFLIKKYTLTKTCIHDIINAHYKFIVKKKNFISSDI